MTALEVYIEKQPHSLTFSVVLVGSRFINPRALVSPDLASSLDGR